MKIAIDVSPLTGNYGLAHRVRGTGFYIENLKTSLLKYHPENQYLFFNRGEKLPEDIDVVHYPYFEPFFLTLPFFKKHKTVVTVHDLTPLVFPQNFPAGLRGRIKWQIQKLALKRAEAIITDSKASKKDIVRYTGIPDKKIQVVYLAAGEGFKKVQSLEFRVQSLRKKYDLPEKFALYVGDVTWNKNLPRLVEAINKTNVSLVVIGKALVEERININNPWNRDLIRVQKLIKNNKRIIPLGFIPQEDLVILYNLASVFVMPSLYEGFGLPLLEAMSCGCPVVTAENGSIPEVVGNAAFFVDGYSVESISSGIKKVFSNKELQNELSKKGLSQADKFSWKKTADETMKVYKNL